jgi:hypothetical protein
VLTGNEITGFTVTNGGSGYTSTPIISRIEPVQAQDGGWRGIIIVNNRFHTLNYAAIANIGPNRHLLKGLVATDNLLDIGPVSTTATSAPAPLSMAVSFRKPEPKFSN